MGRRVALLEHIIMIKGKRLCSYSTSRRVALPEHIIMIANQSMPTSLWTHHHNFANHYALTPRVDVSLYSNTSSWLMPTSLCSYSTDRRVALLEHIMMINANQSMLLLHG